MDIVLTLRVQGLFCEYYSYLKVQGLHWMLRVYTVSIHCYLFSALHPVFLCKEFLSALSFSDLGSLHESQGLRQNPNGFLPKIGIISVHQKGRSSTTLEVWVDVENSGKAWWEICKEGDGTIQEKKWIRPD